MWLNNNHCIQHGDEYYMDGANHRYHTKRVVTPLINMKQQNFP